MSAYIRTSVRKRRGPGKGGRVNELVGNVGVLGWTAVKAALLFITATLALRVARRRTLAQMTVIDIIAAVAIGAIIGRVPNSSDTSFLAGAVTLVVILAVHSLLNRARRWRPVSSVLDHPPRLLVARGRLVEANLRRCGLTRDDVYALVRERGVLDLNQVEYLVYEHRGKVSLVTRETHRATGDADLLAPILHRGRDRRPR